MKEEIVELDKGEKFIISAGSVGQPRDGDKRAKFLLWDGHRGSVRVCAVDYDFHLTQSKIRALGFPEIYADRLG
jgi:diadenosine tetraphosphatase ApaH/serine/threonine PP2A family protein phosphatase